MTSTVFAKAAASFMVLLTFLDFSAFGAATATVTLAWDGSSDPTVVGYRLYYGGKSESYTNVLTISHATTATISNLVQGANYYFAVTAYDASGLESDFSGEVPYTVPITTSPTLTRVNITPGLNGPALVTATGTPGDIYTVLASRDFVSWETLGVAIAGLDGTVQYTDVAAVSAPLRFYRLKRTGP